MAVTENRKEAASLKLEAAQKPSQLQFGPFTLDLQRHGLYMDGKRVHLTSKPFETLAVLVEHRGETVEKQKLLDVVWKDAFVTEDSLVKAVREIRRVLGDEKGSPQFIQTVPGEGYRFIAEVTPANPQRQVFTSSATPTSTVQPVVEVKEPNATQETVTLAVPVRKQSLVRFWTVAAVVGLLAIVATGFLLWPWRESESAAMRPILTLSGLHPGASFSPDGNWIAIIKDDANAVPQVWVQNLNGGQPIPITSGDVPASHPRWSPKNDAIVFNRGQGSQSVWSVPPIGGLDPKLLIQGGRNANWSSDGNQLVFERNEEIWTVDADGTNQQKVIGVPWVEFNLVGREPSFSPDGSQIAFFQSGHGPMGDIWMIPSKGGKAEQLTFDNHLGGGLVWTPDGNIVFSSQRGGSKTLWKIRPGGVPEPVLDSPGEDTHPEISPDGARLIYTRTRNWWVLTLKDLLTGETRELRETLTDMYSPTFSPQGDKILFFATVDGGDIQLFTIPTDGTESTQVTRGKGERNVFPRWSTHGSFFYFYQLQPTVSFRQIPVAGGKSSLIADGWTWRTHNNARVDPQGKRVVFTRQENHKRTTIVREIETGKETVFEPTLGDPQWSRDGQSVLGFEITPATPWGQEFGDIMVCPVESGKCRKVANRGTAPIWSDDESRIYFARWTAQGVMEIWSVSANGEGEQRVVELQNPDPHAATFDVSQTGQVVYVQFKLGKPELWMKDFK